MEDGRFTFTKKINLLYTCCLKKPTKTILRNVKSSCPALNQNQNGTTSSDYTIFEIELPSKYNFWKTVLPWKYLHFFNDSAFIPQSMKNKLNQALWISLSLFKCAKISADFHMKPLHWFNLYLWRLEENSSDRKKRRMWNSLPLVFTFPQCLLEWKK